MTITRASYCVAAPCILCTFIAFAPPIKGQAKPAESLKAADPVMVLQDLVSKKIAIVSRASTDAEQLTETEWRAVADLGASRSPLAVDSLLRIVHLREPNLGHPMKMPDGSFVRMPTRSQVELRHALATRAGLSNRPAAEALVGIGLPSVAAIIVELDRIRKKPVPTETLRLYAKVLLSILGPDHVRAYMLEERAHAPKSADAEYERLLALPEMNPKPRKWRRGASKDTEE